MGISGDIALIIVTCLVCGLAAQRLGFPLLLGYIVAGVLVSPNTFGPSVSNVHDIELLADIGVALLLFTVGLEFPAEKLRAVRHVALIGAPLQMLAVGAFGFAIGKLMGWDGQQSIWFGALISISSTMVVLKILMSRGLMETLSSKVMLGILVVQDLAVVPLMILLPALGNLEQGMAVLGVALVRAIVFVAIMALVGTRFLPSLLARAVYLQSRELFIVVVIGIAMGVGYATYLAGLSFAFGAFLAGLVLSRSQYSHDALRDMVPLREVFSLLFFAGVGMMLSLDFLWTHLLQVCFLVIAVLVGKGLLMALITRAFGYMRIIPLAVALSMSQVGEFAFVLARLGQETGSLQKDVYYLVVSVAVVTMALTPFSSSPSFRLYQWLRRNQPQPTVEELPRVSAADRLLVIGYSRLGRFMCRILAQLGHPPLVLASDQEQVREAREEGLAVVYAEETSSEVLSALEAGQAALVVVTLMDRFANQLVNERLRESGAPPTVTVAVSQEHLAELTEAGIDDVVLAPLETGLEMVHQTLRRLDYDSVEAHTIVDGIRHNHYELHATREYDPLLASLRLEWLEVGVDQITVDEGFHSRTGTTVVAATRRGELVSGREMPLELERGDKLAVTGTHSQRAGARRLVAATQ